MADRIRIGRLSIDPVTLEQALDAIERILAERRGGYVLTPNVDHVVRAERDERFRNAYAQASLSLVDGMPVLWASRMLKTPLPAKVSGSDLVGPLMQRAETKGYRVFLFGGAPGSAERARENILKEWPRLPFVGAASPRVDVSDPDQTHDLHVRTILDARTDLVLVGLGAPKQELFCHAVSERVRPAVLLGVGAAIDFLAGAVPRAPRWMSNHGLEWLFRLSREPRRLFVRYLVRDPEFAIILLRQLWKQSE